ncbi:MAG: DUF4349 domain-containing protein [Gemmataceae bacterium]|nr:DUF4349 domain-containing protein [Gemmataceae bacterium]
MSEHAWFQENLAGYVAAGLPADERARFETHAGACRDCAQALAEQRAFDAAMATLFAAARPTAGFENRVLKALRAEPLRRRVQWVKTLRWIGGAAAVIMLGVIGFGMHEFAQTGALPFVGDRALGAAGDAGEPIQHTQVATIMGGVAAKPKASPEELVLEVWNGPQATTTKYRLEVLAQSRESSGNPTKEDAVGELVKRLDKAKEYPPGRSDPEKDKVNVQGLGEGKAPLDGMRRAQEAKEGLVAAEERLKDLASSHTARVVEVVKGKVATTWTALPPPGETTSEQLAALRGKLGGESRGGGSANPNDDGLARPGTGGGFAYRRGFQSGGAAPSDPSSSKSQESKPSTDGRSGPMMGFIAPGPGQGTPINPPPPGLMGPSGNQKLPLNYYSASPTSPVAPPAPVDGKYDDGGKAAGKPGSRNKESDDVEDGYFRATRDKTGMDPDGRLGKQFAQAQGKSQTEGGQQKDGKGGQKTPDDQGAGKQGFGKQPPGKQPPDKTKPPVEAKAAARKIIRTGEVEFEIQVFDDAIASVTRLITGIPGAFVATVNSEKLPNGKVRGSIIVRTPPEALDQFLLDLRKELGKTGELKGQRIGSQDVTKAYYDLESRLRAARTMEDRLINIIKSGKGEIKDLLLAEKELGVWRTKIEEMEGEIRYYNNQVSLSTLTITLYEKEIRSAAAMVISERVNMKIESDDVEGSLQKALMAVAEAKGRVLRSDAKQYDTTGQSEAHLQFEVAPAAAPAMKDKLRKLGIVTHYDAQRQQQAEGGTGSAGVEIKTRQSDVHFTVEIFNVANIQPREAYKLEIACEDVPADYRRLQEAVTQASGQVRSGNLNEQDKLNINAQFDFDVPATARNVMENLVTGLGDVLSRTTKRAPANERATERKVGFRLTLLNLANIKPREAYKLDIATQDVSAEYRRLQDAIAKAKGQIHSIGLNEQDKLNASAQINFDVPKTARDTFDKLLAGLGDVLTRSTMRAGPTEIATDRKSGYRLTLLNLANIPSRESYRLEIATTDVSADYRKLQEAIAAAKGQVRAINLNEQDKLNTSAQLDFDVPADERAKIDELAASLGEITVRQTLRVPPGQTATSRKAGYQLTLRNIASVPPRETYTIQAVSLDVPGAYKKLHEAVAQAKGYVRVGQLNEHDKLNISAQFDFDVPTPEREVIEKLLVEIGDAYSRNTQRVPPNQVATDRKVGYQLALQSVAGMPPREKVTLDVEVKDVEQAATTFKDMVRSKGGTIVADPINHNADGLVKAMLLFNVPLSAKDELVRKFKAFGTVRESKSSTNPQAADTKLATVHIDVMLSNATPIVPSDQGLWPQIRRSLSLSFQFLSLSLTFIILGLMVVLPWALLLWVAVKLFKRLRGKTPSAAATGA